MKWCAPFFLCSALFLWSCKGSQGFGETCRRDRDCAQGLCVAGDATSAQGRCTRSCATDDQCPQGYSCRGATNQGVIICLPGPALPFGSPPPGR